jgi:hypothetical protein
LHQDIALCRRTYLSFPPTLNISLFLMSHKCNLLWNLRFLWQWVTDCGQGRLARPYRRPRWLPRVPR